MKYCSLAWHDIIPYLQEGGEKDLNVSTLPIHLSVPHPLQLVICDGNKTSIGCFTQELSY